MGSPLCRDDAVSLAGQLLGLLLGGGIGVAAAIIPLMLVEKRVAQLSEQ